MESSLTKILFFCALIFSSSLAFTQVNTGFEAGLNGWVNSGQKENISIDSTDQYQGKFCASIGKNATIAQKVEITPLSVLQFNFYIKCSDTTTKAFSFIRFYDMHDRELLEYKSGRISSTKYEETGNYTEAPPFTKYALIGIERDSSEGFAYIDAMSADLNIGAPAGAHKPTCNLDEYMIPFWKSDTIYNETVLLYSKNNQPAMGKLLFQPSKILSVKSFNLKTNYQQRIDYSINDNIIERSASSKMLFRADTSFDKKNNLAWFNLQSQWIVVTYIHNDKWAGPFNFL